MIKSFVFIGLAFLVVGFFVSYFVTGKTPDLAIPSIPDLSVPESWKDLPTLFTEEEVIDSEYKAYKWQDEDGVWHFEQTAPEGKLAEELVIEPINTIDYAEVAPFATETPESPSRGANQSFNPYSSDGIQGLLEEAQNVQRVLDERAAEQQGALDGL